jgi:dodecin
MLLPHFKEEPMSVAKVITIVGSSPAGFAEAAAAAVKEAAKTVRGIRGADVTSMTCTVDGDQIKEYRATVNIAFEVQNP